VIHDPVGPGESEIVSVDNVYGAGLDVDLAHRCALESTPVSCPVARSSASTRCSR